MILCSDFVDFLNGHEIDFFCGVPDSLLASLSQSLDREGGRWQHHVTANEGSAIAIAAGHHLATTKLAAVYMQNSGLGNALNPLVSLADKNVYAIPMLLVIGWRAEMTQDGQLSDEPQHIKQGQITSEILDLLGIPYFVLGPDNQNWQTETLNLLKQAKTGSKPVAILVRKNSLIGEKRLGVSAKSDYEMTQLPTEMPVIATTGKASRELFEIRHMNKDRHDKDFLTVGSMGHASQIAAGIALSNPKAKVLCLDGDGACLMHLGGLKTVAKLANFKHILLHNGVHDSVGGQSTVGGNDSLMEIARACGFHWLASVSSQEGLEAALDEFLKSKESAFLEVRVRAGSRKDLGRPTIKPKDNKTKFMRFFSETLGSKGRG